MLVIRGSDAVMHDLLQQQDAGGPGDTHPSLFQSVVSESARSLVGLIIAVGYGDALGSVIATWGRKTRGAGAPIRREFRTTQVKGGPRDTRD